jgi:hypothetical protein
MRPVSYRLEKSERNEDPIVAGKANDDCRIRAFQQGRAVSEQRWSSRLTSQEINARLVVSMMLLVCIIQSARSRTRNCSYTSSHRTSRQGADPRSTSRPNSYTLGGINMTFVPNVSTVRMGLTIRIRLSSAKARNYRSDKQPS